MKKDQIFEKMLADIRLLFKAKRKLQYISGKNELTSLAIDSSQKVMTAKREGDQSVSVPFDHLQRVATAFADDSTINIDALFQGSGNGRSVIETVVAHLPNVGYLQANKPPNTGPKKLVWFDSEVNILGQILEASALMEQRQNSKFLGGNLTSINDLSAKFFNDIFTCCLKLEEVACRRFSASLLTKRFCILNGLAGSGKTKLTEAFAMWLCESDDQYRVVAVGADWTSNENLLGYADALNAGAYQLPSNGVLDLIIKAGKDDKRPYFLILDEMNLSHVERYFADFLSAMESSNSKLRLHGVTTGLLAGTTSVPHELALPENLFIIGTVNVDETTYMFSPKVLDRANVIEFRATHDQMAAFLDDPAGINLEALKHQGAAFSQAFVQRSKDGADIATLVNDAGVAYGPQLRADLLVLFTALAAMGAEFGFRSAKEIARFMVIHKELSGAGWQYKDALDAQVLQKLMPKLHGSARKLDGVLKELDAFATAEDLPLTREKVKRMQDRLKRDGFTSFAEA